MLPILSLIYVLIALVAQKKFLLVLIATLMVLGILRPRD